jgi:quercetin dioxygenase-like cupin family protein
MSDNYTFFGNLADEAPVPDRGVLSRTLSNGNGVEFLVFGFAPGEQLSEHTSARPAIIHVLSGEGDLTVAGDPYPAQAGTWLRMAPDTRHSVVARTPLLMALYLLPA